MKSAEMAAQPERTVRANQPLTRDSPAPAARDGQALQVVAPPDWELLLRAVQARLRTIANEPPGSADPRQLIARLNRLQAMARECGNALGPLQPAPVHDTARCEQLEHELRDAQAALARARVELDGTRAGEQQARHLALHDCLTALPNRRCFGDRLERALGVVHADHSGLGLFYMDLDGLKGVNDVHGHDTGDEVLRIVATRLSRAVRAHDTVCRLGGDEFACLFCDALSREQLTHMACKLFDAVSTPVQIGERRLVVRPSIGIATCPADGVTAAALLKHADAAMYRAKRGQTGYAFADEPPRLTSVRPVSAHGAAVSTATAPSSMGARGAR